MCKCSRELKAVNGAIVLLVSALHALNNKRHAVLVKVIS